MGELEQMFQEVVAELLRQQAQERLTSQFWAQQGYVVYLFDANDKSDQPYPVGLFLAPTKLFSD